MCWRTPRLWFPLNCVYFFALFYIFSLFFIFSHLFFNLFYPFSTFSPLIFRSVTFLLYPFYSFLFLKPFYNLFYLFIFPFTFYSSLSLFLFPYYLFYPCSCLSSLLCLCVFPLLTSFTLIPVYVFPLL